MQMFYRVLYLLDGDYVLLAGRDGKMGWASWQLGHGVLLGWGWMETDVLVGRRWNGGTGDGERWSGCAGRG